VPEDARRRRFLTDRVLQTTHKPPSLRPNRDLGAASRGFLAVERAPRARVISGGPNFAGEGLIQTQLAITTLAGSPRRGRSVRLFDDHGLIRRLRGASRRSTSDLWPPSCAHCGITPRPRCLEAVRGSAMGRHSPGTCLLESRKVSLLAPVSLPMTGMGTWVVGRPPRRSGLVSRTLSILSPPIRRANRRGWMPPSHRLLWPAHTSSSGIVLPDTNSPVRFPKRRRAGRR